MAKQQLAEIATHDAREADWRIVADYRSSGEQFIQDGFAFGPGPLLPGHLEVTTAGNKPVFSVAHSGAVRRDLQWVGLKAAGGTQGEPGALGKVPRPGQTLRTPTFTIESGSVQYLVRGAGMAQAVVGSHRLIAGPLHGSLIKSFNTRGKLQWISQNLSRYKGERVHLEIAPTGDGPLEIVMVVDQAGGLPIPQLPNRAAAEVLAERSAEATGTVALQSALVDLLRRSLEIFASGSFSGKEGPALAAVAGFAVANPQLFVTDDNSALREARQIAKELFAEEERLAGQIKKESRTAISIWDGSGEDEFLLIRGNSKTPGKLVPRRFLEALGGKLQSTPETGSGRLELARQMVNAQQNPFISRVIVNRIWHHLFGRGIVPSVDNFGVLGQPPSHPQLLDRLATDFVEQGWSLKKTIRALMLSRTYLMSSKPLHPRAERMDPENILLHRMRVRRLQGEVIRDAILAISGRLDHQLEGPSVPVYLTAFMTGRGRPRGGPLDGAGRRSIYIEIRRNFLSPMMLAFDTPTPFNPVGRRNVSNVPAQALILMNDPLVVEQTKVWAGNVLKSTAEFTPEQRIDWMYQTAFSRPATETELVEGTKFLAQQASLYGLSGEAWKNDARVWADYGHVLWNVKEFIFIH